jgi:hypothetical protein
MFRNIVRAIAVGVTLAAAAQQVSAQDPVRALEDALSRSFQSAAGEGGAVPQLLEATALMQEARGFKEEASRIRALIEDVNKGASRPEAKSGEVVSTVVSGANEELKKTLAQPASEMTNAQKEMFVQGATAYFEGTRQTISLINGLRELSSAVSAAAGVRNPAQARRVPGLTNAANGLIKALPDVSQANIQTATALKEYITANNLPVPAAAMVW